jgi:hypothetical protein
MRGTVWVSAALLMIGCHSSSSSSTTQKSAMHASSASKEECCGVEPMVATAAPRTKPAAAKEEVATFGAPQKLSDADAVTASTVLSSPDKYADQYVRITGTVTDVCAKKGCWMRVAAADAPKGSPDIFIKFRDPAAGRLVPMEAVGKETTVEGVLKVGQLSERAARHFKEDAGAPQDEIEKIVGPQKQLMLAAPAVAIEGVAKSPQ